MLHPDLGRAQDMPRRVKGKLHPANIDLLPILDGLNIDIPQAMPDNGLG
jgi:hypothetical protein